MSTLLGPRDENGIPVPMTVDESIASMKASLLKKIKRSAYVLPRRLWRLQRLRNRNFRHPFAAVRR
ncbi:formate hydrogenlyase subunit 7 [Klebsiella pneumoniae]|nr:formate hydrogenlyase subunit 7 [Klebsiella pneumoniae]